MPATKPAGTAGPTATLPTLHPSARSETNSFMEHSSQSCLSALSAAQIHLVGRFPVANPPIPAAAMPGRARTQVATISRNAMVEPRLNTRKGKYLKNSDTRRGGNIPRTYVPRTLDIEKQYLVSFLILLLLSWLIDLCLLYVSSLTHTSLYSQWPASSTPACSFLKEKTQPNKHNKTKQIPSLPHILNSYISSLAILQASVYSNFSMPLHFSWQSHQFCHNCMNELRQFLLKPHLKTYR